MKVKHYSVETNSTYERFDNKSEAKESFRQFKVTGVPAHLYEVDEFGVCHELECYR